MFKPKEKRGRIFDNQADKKRETQPDFTGSVTVNDEVFRVSAWYSPPDQKRRTGSYGLQLQPMAEYLEQKRERNAQNEDPPAVVDPDNDCPF